MSALASSDRSALSIRLRAIALRAVLPSFIIIVTLHTIQLAYPAFCAPPVLFTVYTLLVSLAMLRLVKDHATAPYHPALLLGLYCTIIPAMETATILRHRNTATDEDELRDLLLIGMVHGSNFVFAIALLGTYGVGRVSAWQGTRLYCTWIGVFGLGAAFGLLAIGAARFPAPGGTGSFAVTVWCCSCSLLVAAGTRPSIRSQLLELWVAVPLSSLGQAVMNSALAAAAAPASHVLVSSRDSSCSESEASTFLVHDTGP